MVTPTRSIASIIFLIAVIFIPTDGYGAEILATTDRNPVAVNESFQLTLSSVQSPDSDPDFTPLEQQFDILNQSRSSNISLVNGNVTRSMVWTLTLIAKQEGQITIPSILFGSDKSLAIPLTVEAAAGNKSTQTNQDLYIEAEITPQDPYVQSQAIYTIRIFQNIEIAQASLSDPQLDDAVIEKLGEDKNYSSQKGGNRYAVIERKFAIFPQKSGDQTIAPIQLTADVITTPSSNSRFRGFFSRPSTKTMQLNSKAITLKVKPIPAEFKGRHWLPAQMLHVEQKWSNSPPRINVGEPITRTLQLLAKGVSVSQLPELGSLERQTAQMRYYPDQPVLKEKKEIDHIIAFREEKTALIPDQPGDYTLPAIQIPWWNTQDDRMETAIVPETTITVLPAAGNPLKPPEEAPAKSLKPRADEIGEKPDAISVSNAPKENIWRWVSLILAVGWVGTLLLISLKGKKNRGKPLRESRTPNEKQARQAVKKACGQNDPVKTRIALLDWAKTYWIDKSPSSLEAIGRRTGGDLATEATRLNQVLYRPDPSEWNGSALWQAFQRLEQPDQVDTDGKNLGLEPLYKV